MNAAFEDCVVLDECLEQFPNDRSRAFAEYFSRRKVNADALADLAVQNFIEMRDKTASRVFRTKKKLDHLLEGLLPGIYLPLYAMVTFTRIPYANAAERARLQDRIVYARLLRLLCWLMFVLRMQPLWCWRCLHNVRCCVCFVERRSMRSRLQSLGVRQCSAALGIWHRTMFVRGF